MSKKKGRAAARGAAQGARVYMALLVIQAFLQVAFGVTVPPLEYAARLLILMVTATLGVVTAWNLWAWLGEDAARRKALRDADRAGDLLSWYPGPEQGLLVTGTDERARPVHFPVYGAAALAVQRAAERGTFSVNGYRYMGPPPVVRVTHAEYEVREGVRMITGMRVTEERMLPSGRRVVKSECGECGAPLDVARCEPGWHYLCPRCRASQVFRPY